MYVMAQLSAYECIFFIENMRCKTLSVINGRNW